MEQLPLHPMCLSALHEWLAGTLDFVDPDAFLVYVCTQTNSNTLDWVLNLVSMAP